MNIKLLSTALVAATVAACQTAPPLFEFGSYEQSLYVYYKKPDQADRYRESLEKAIEKGEKNSNVAPGMYAELGYLNSLQGDLDTAIELYEMEMVMFPESKFFLSRVVSSMQKNAADGTDNATKDEVGA